MIRSMEEFTSAFRAARCVSTPLVAVRTADPASTTHFIIETLKQGRELPPLLGWDVVRGLYAIGKDIGEELARVLGDRQPETVGPAEALFLAQQLCEDGLLFYSNAHRFWNEPGVMQGIWNLRDSLRTLAESRTSRVSFAPCSQASILRASSFSLMRSRRRLQEPAPTSPA
jgi:hypothetical protein